MRPEIDPTSFKECASAAWALALRPPASVLAGSEADGFTGGCGFAPLLQVTFALAGLCTGTWQSRVSLFPDPFPDGAP